MSGTVSVWPSSEGIPGCGGTIVFQTTPSPRPAIGLSRIKAPDTPADIGRRRAAVAEILMKVRRRSTQHSIRPRHAEHVLAEIGEDQVGRDRCGLIEAGFAP